MKMERAFLNKKEGNTICCWNAPTVADLASLFQKAGAPFEKMFEVDEQMAEALGA